MAISLFYAKTYEDATKVTYRFGGCWEAMDQTLTIDTRTLGPAGDRHDLDGLERRVLQRVVGQRTRQGVWPDRGGQQS